MGCEDGEMKGGKAGRGQILQGLVKQLRGIDVSVLRAVERALVDFRNHLIVFAYLVNLIFGS